MNREQIVSQLKEWGAVAVIRLKTPDRLGLVVDAVFRGGVSAIEITMTVPGAMDAIRQLADRESGVLVGAGTVLDEGTAVQAIEAGARYIVSPVMNPDLIRTGHDRGVPVFVAGFTPTEIYAAHHAGADMVKVFPANILGVAFFKALQGPLPQVRLMPTGGVTPENAGEWIGAGACVVGIGGALIDKEAIASEQYDVLTNKARILMQSIAKSRGLSV